MHCARLVEASVNVVRAEAYQQCPPNAGAVASVCFREGVPTEMHGIRQQTISTCCPCSSGHEGDATLSNETRIARCIVQLRNKQKLRDTYTSMCMPAL